VMVSICPYVGGGGFAGLVILTSTPCSSRLLVLGGGLVCLPDFAMCVCVCVGLVHLVVYGRENKTTKATHL